MFCRKSKKKKVPKDTPETARAVSWRQIEDAAVTWPTDQVTPATTATPNGNDVHSKTTEETLSKLPSPVISIAQEVTIAETTLTKLSVVNNHQHEIQVVIEEPPNDITTKPVIETTDANANHIFPPRPSDAASVEFRPSAASILSNNSSGTRSSSGSAVLLRRHALREDDDEDEVELTLHEITSQDEEAITKALQSNDFITAVAADSVKYLGKYMTRLDVTQGEVIMHQGEKGDSMYVSKKGEFQVQRDKEIIGRFKEGRLFGELAILYNKPRVATVTALTDGTLWQLRRNVFKTLLRQSNAQANDAVLEFLRKVPVINAASDSKLQLIAALCESRYYAKDSVIVREGKLGDEFFIVKTGTATVSKAGQGKVKQLKRGDFFGERALLNEDKRKATVSAGSYGVECLILNRREFMAYLGDVTQFIAQAEEEQEDPLPLQTNDEHRFAKYKEITLNDLSKVRKLGEGGFGTVYLVKCSKGNKQFALKELPIDKVTKANIVHNAYNERNIQKACDTIFIVQLYRTFKDKTCLYFLLEFCPRAELFPLLRKKHHFSDAIARFVGACVLEALIYLHRRRVAYLDLKPENIMIDRDGYPKLADFGNAVQLEQGKKTYSFLGTPEYMAPEIFAQRGTDRAADCWAFGVLIYEMLMGKSPFYHKDEQRLVENISKGLTGKHFPPNFHKPAKEIIRGLMHLNPIKRLGCLRGGMKELRKHDWFKDIDFEKLAVKGIRSPLLSLYKK